MNQRPLSVIGPVGELLTLDAFLRPPGRWRNLQMAKRIPLDRLRDISRQRSIRTPHPAQRPEDSSEANAPELEKIEWPIRASVWL